MESTFERSRSGLYIPKKLGKLLSNFYAFRRLGDPLFNRLGARGLPWGFGPKAGAAFSPADLDGLGFWFRADAETGYNDGDSLDPMTDQAGVADNLTSVIVGTYETNEINGLPVARGNGIDQFWNNDAVVAPAGHKGSFLIVKKQDTSIAIEPLWSNDNGGIENWNFQFNGTGTFIYVNNVTRNDNNAGWFADDTPHIISFYTDGTDWFLRVNGVQRLQVGYVHPVGLGNRYYSCRDGAAYGEFDILEIIHYNSDVSGNIADIEAYLAERGGISI